MGGGAGKGGSSWVACCWRPSQQEKKVWQAERCVCVSVRVCLCAQTWCRVVWAKIRAEKSLYLAELGLFPFSFPTFPWAKLDLTMVLSFPSTWHAPKKEGQEFTSAMCVALSSSAKAILYLLDLSGHDFEKQRISDMKNRAFSTIGK